MSLVMDLHLNYLRLILTIFIMILVSNLHCQVEPERLTQYTEEDGLPSSQVYEILTDKLGFIWIGTLNGLARFDGYEFKRYYSDPNDPNSFKGLNIWNIYQDKQGKLWISSGPSFLNMYSPITRTFKQYKYTHLVEHVPDLMELGITCAWEDHKGTIYFGVSTNHGEEIKTGLLYLDSKEDVIRTHQYQETGNIYRCSKDIFGNTWMLCKAGLAKMDTAGVITIVKTPTEKITKDLGYANDILNDEDGNLWLITSKIHLVKYNIKTQAFQVFSPLESNVNDELGSSYPNMALDKMNNIWFGTTKGLQNFNIKTEKFNTISADANQRLIDAGILTINFDLFGSLWIGTFSGGIYRYDEKSLFKSYSYGIPKNPITSGWANNIYETKSGSLCITTSAPAKESGISFLDPVTGKVTKYPFKSFLPEGNMIYGVIEISPGEFYISTDIGHYKFTPSSNRIQKIDLPGLPKDLGIVYYFLDSEKNMWLCTPDGLFKKAKNQRNFSRIDISNIGSSNPGSNSITHLFESKINGLWIITNNGLFLYNYSNDNITRHGNDKSKGDVFISQDINSFYEDSKGIAWVGTWQGGLSRYNIKTGEIKTFTRDDGLPSMSVQGILGDDKNNDLWLATFEGLSRFNITTQQFNNFSVADGIQSPLFADGAYLKTSGGLFVFGGSNGITLFRPEDIHSHSLPPSVFLTDLKLFNKSVLPGENSLLSKPIYDTREITLSHNQNTLTIEFMAIHFSNPSKNKSAYILENYDTEWREVGNQRFAFYSMLPPGEYVFRVKAANNNEVWTAEGVSLIININPPWWRTTWAYISYVIVLALLIYMLNRYFKYRLIQQERIRGQKRELEHAREIQKAYTELKNTQSQLIQSEKMASLGELTAGIAHEIKNPLNFVNNFSELNSELIEELENDLKSGNHEGALTIASNLKENENKISFHGKRADAIVKGMLQHSRTSSGIKEPTDINALSEEFIKLSYHGLRAKDKSFNAIVETEFDDSIGHIPVIPQELGRVILNLLNNAFYATQEKKKLFNNNYTPRVSIKTAKFKDGIEIIVQDNGMGIKKTVIDKIFQPFFTTKPTGQGTGLGLSISYDIITKGHDGELSVETIEGEGSTFRVWLPLTNSL